jgi:hypothetical protein
MLPLVGSPLALLAFLAPVSAAQDAKSTRAFLHDNSAKARHLSHGLTPSQIVELCMLPVLVVLSGLFAGLILA